MKFMMLLGYAAMSLPLFSSGAVKAATTGPKPLVEPTFVRPTIAGMDMTAAYLVIKNNTNKVIHLTKVTSPVAEKVEIHDSRLDNGIVRMREVNSLEIPVGDLARFEPAGRHLMLTGLKHELNVGDKVELELHFEKVVVKTELPVRN